MSASTTLTQQFDLVFTFIGGNRHGQSLSIQTEQCLLALGDHDGADDQPLCAIYRSIDGVAIRNLDEQTLVNGKPKITHWLRPGDQIQFSNSVTLEVTQLGSISPQCSRDAVSVCSPTDYKNQLQCGDSSSDTDLENRLESLSERLDRLSDQVLGLIDAVCHHTPLPDSIISSNIKRVSGTVNSATGFPAEIGLEAGNHISDLAKSDSKEEPSEFFADQHEPAETSSDATDSAQISDFNPSSFSAASFGSGELDMEEVSPEEVSTVEKPTEELSPAEMPIDNFNRFEEIDSPEFHSKIDLTANAETDASEVANQPLNAIDDDDQRQISAMLQGLLSEFKEEKNESERLAPDFDSLTANFQTSEIETEYREQPASSLTESGIDSGAESGIDSGDSSSDAVAAGSEDLADILARLRAEIDWTDEPSASDQDVETKPTNDATERGTESIFSDLLSQSPTEVEDRQTGVADTFELHQESQNHVVENSVQAAISAGDTWNDDSVADFDSPASEFEVGESEVTELNPTMETPAENEALSEPESVEEYMNRLLARMNVSEAADQSPSSAPSESEYMSETNSPSASVRSMEKGGCQNDQNAGFNNDPQEDLTAEQVMGRSKTEKPMALNAMRDLANSSTRTAIMQCELSQRQTRGLMMAAFSAGATVLSIYYFFFISNTLGDMPFFIGCLGILTAIAMGIISLVILKSIKLEIPHGLILNHKTEKRVLDGDQPHRAD